MAEQPNPQTPGEGNPGNEGTQNPKDPTKGTGPQGKEVKTTPPAGEPTAEERIAALEQKVEEGKEKLSASAREALRLLGENKKLKVKLESNISGEPPSDEELSKSIKDWDMLSSVEQNLIREQILLKRKINHLSNTLAQTTEEIEFTNSFNLLVQDPDFAPLKDKKDEFRVFCKENEGVSLDVLARSFLFDTAKDIGAEEEKERKRPGLEPGSGGPKTPPAPGITAEEADRIRQEDPQRYERLVRSGQIDPEKF